MSTYVGITPEQREYIVEHYGKIPVLEMAKMFGVCDMTIYKLLKKEGVDTRKHHVPLQKEEIEKVIELYPNTPNEEIARIVNRKIWEILRVKKLYKLKKSHEYIHSVRVENLKKVDRAKSLAAAQAGFRKKYKRAVFEKLSGMKPTTKLKVSLIPRRISMIIYNIKRRHNYFQVEGEPYTFYYDEDTKRSNKEEYYINKYEFKFKKAEEEDKEEEENKID